MDAINFLLKEHNTVKKLLTDISDESHRDTARKELFDRLCNDLLRHETMEETVFYPYLRKQQNLNDTVKHLITEEKNAEKAIKQFDHVKSQKEWEEKFSKFKKDVEHHASEEERELFPEVKKLLSQEDLEKIGKEMEAFKKSYRVH